MGKSYRNSSATFRKPKRPFEKERLEDELKLVGQYGLKNKRETWRVLYTLAKIRKAARVLLTLDEKDEVRVFQGELFLLLVVIKLIRPKRYADYYIVYLTPMTMFTSLSLSSVGVYKKTFFY